MNTPLQNDTFIRALLRQPVDYTPVWMMRQAGRYLPEYREVRAQAGDFLTLCKTPELACKVTLQPLERFAFDAAILFSDILTIPDAMQLGLHFVNGEGPQFEHPLRDAQSIEQLPLLNPETDLGYVMDAVRLIKRELKQRVPLIGFAGSPWTLATYMVEGQSTRTFSRVKAMMLSEPQTFQLLLEKLTRATIDYLNAQIAAGVDVVMLFDTWGGVLTTEHYKQYSLAAMQHIVNSLHRERDGQKIPVILFTKGGGQWLETMADTGCDALGLDWTIDIDIARQRVGNRVALQGNLDPAILYATPDVIRREVKAIIDKFGKGSGHVFNLGHGITPDVDPDNVAVFVDAVHEFSQSTPTL